MSASMLHLHAIRLMKSVLAGTETKKLQDVLEAAFGSDEEDDDNFVPEEEEAASTSSGIKRKAPQPSGSSKQKASHPTKGGISALTNATLYHPTTLDAATSYLHSDVDSAFFLSCKLSQTMKSAGYECNYSVPKKAEGVLTPDCTFFFMTNVSCLHTSGSTTSVSPLDVMFVQLNAGGLHLLGWST